MFLPLLVPAALVGFLGNTLAPSVRANLGADKIGAGVTSFELLTLSVMNPNFTAHLRQRVPGSPGVLPPSITRQPANFSLDVPVVGESPAFLANVPAKILPRMPLPVCPSSPWDLCAYSLPHPLTLKVICFSPNTHTRAASPLRPCPSLFLSFLGRTCPPCLPILGMFSRLNWIAWEQLQHFLTIHSWTL